jgi:MraZ protein
VTAPLTPSRQVGTVSFCVEKWGNVSSTGYFGAASLTLDGKGRLSVPARHREALQNQAQGQLAITKHPDGCLMVFPQPVWTPFRDRIAALPMEALEWKRVFLGFVSEVEIDGASRVLIDPVLRAYAGLQRDVLLIGIGPHFELWDAVRYAEREQRVVQQPMPDSIKGFTY